MKFAFRCYACGHLEHAGQAGESGCPHACSACGAGVEFNPRTGAKRVVTDNWEHLCMADDARLKELGLTRDQVEEHTPAKAPAPPDRPPRHVEARAGDGAGVVTGADQ